MDYSEQCETEREIERVCENGQRRNLSDIDW